MANGFVSTPFNAPMLPDFSAGMPMVTPVQVLPAQEAKSPIDTLKEVFFDIRDGIKNLVDQSKEALGLQKEEDREQDIKQSLSDDTVTTDDGESKSIIDSLKEQFESLKEGFREILSEQTDTSEVQLPQSFLDRTTDASRIDYMADVSTSANE